MNESTFETHLSSAIEKIFPTILTTRIETQRVFTLKFGHGVLTKDGPASYATGRSDVILHVDAKPTILLELKRPDLALTDEDVSQGISYARVHDPMIPIVVVANGTDVRIHSSFDRSKIGEETLDEKRIAAILQTTSNQAASSREDPALLMRLYVAASSLDGITDADTQERATKMKRELSAALDSVFDVIHGPDEETI